MPLASSRESSEKRAAVVQAEKKEQERRRRISLPKTCRSTTRVTCESAKRRRSSRAMSEERMKKQSKQTEDKDPAKENFGSPSQTKKTEAAPVLSPMPYWKVAKERRGSKKFSPRLTRSNKKGKPPRNSEAALVFSPPDQEVNDRREKEELQAKEEARKRNISEAQQNGQLLVFSPNSMSCRNFNMDDDEDNRESDPWQGEEEEKEEDHSFASNQSPFSDRSKFSELTSSKQSQSQSQYDDELKEEIRGIKQNLEVLANDRVRYSDAGVLQGQRDKMELEAERVKSETLLNTKTKLEATILELQTKLAENKEGFLVESTCLKSQLNTSANEHAVKVKSLEEAIAVLKQEKANLLEQINLLQEDLKASKDMLSANEKDTEAIGDLMERVEVLKNKEAKTEEEKTALGVELSKMKEIRGTLEEKIKKCEGELALFKKKACESEVELQTALDKSRSKEAASEKEIQNKESTISDLMERINGLRAEKEDSQEVDGMNKELNKQIIELKNTIKEKDQHVSELKATLSATEQKFRQSRDTFIREREDVKNNISGLERKLEESAENLRIAKEKEAKKAEEARQNKQRIHELEGHLQATKGRLENTESRLSTSDEREDELLRKLQESDKIRIALHNRVTQLSGNIRVFVRVRPPILGEEEKAIAVVAEQHRGSRKRKASSPLETPFHFPGELDGQGYADLSDDITKRLIEVKEPAQDRGGLSERRKAWRFPFDNVFTPSAGQNDVWEATEPLVQSAIDGYPVCIFAYGQTGSGKTYTMLGGPENKGIIARAVDKIFDAKKQMEEYSKGTTKCEISIELLEIYNEQVRDLLAPNSGPNGREIPLKVTSNEVVGNIVVPVNSESEVMDILALAQSRRCVKSTQSNTESSRSHMVFTLHLMVEMKDGISRTGKLNICDLAGSERLGKSGANTVVRGDLMKETKNINSSLSVLSNVIEKLQAGSSTVPFRESKLTFLLKDSLGGNSKTLCIVCCNPLGAHFHESLCSLRFAHKVGKVELKSVANFSC